VGLFDWLFGKRQAAAAGTPARPRPPRPKVLGGLDNNSPQVVIDAGNGVVTVMDRETFDYLYGESTAPDPTQRQLDEMLRRVTRVRALAGGLFRGRATGSEVLVDTADPAAVAAFRQTLRVVEDPATFSHCACLGGPTLELYAGEELAATVGLQHGHSIRWPAWKHDARLRDGKPLNDWLAAHGIEAGFLDLLFHNQYDAGGMMPVGVLRGGPTPLSRAEQRLRLAEMRRVRGGDLDDALAEVRRVLDAEPGLAFGHLVAALIHQQRGDHERSVAGCTEALRLGLRHPEAPFTRAVSLDTLGRPQEALADCTAALEIDPNHVNAWNSRGLIRGRLGQHDQALADLDEAIRRAPQWDLPYLNRVGVHIGRNDPDAGIADCDRILDRIGKSEAPAQRALAAAVYWNRAQCYRMKGDESRAEADFREAVRRNPNLARGGQGR
jgi:tetratricopeptide (TPR) repeat protein